MKQLIKSLIPPILFSIYRKLRSAPSSAQKWPDDVTIGSNTEVEGNIFRSRAQKSKVIIGNDCLICGDISMEADDAVLEIGDNVYIGNRTNIICSKYIKIESDILISTDCMIQDSDNHSMDFNVRKKDLADWKNGQHDWSTHPRLPIIISHGAWIGAKSIILKGVTIGEQSVIGAGSVVTKSVEPFHIAAGNPAKVIKKMEK